MTHSVVPSSIFRAYDIRGIVGRTLTADIARLIGLDIGAEAAARGEQEIVVGRDGRDSSPAFSNALITG
ncbi:MAG: phosphomannomutase/phosphoglucomutase, partial [Gammaproteobacteria bacterium]|nr:phosphomannomutase/phosphoglucomutase [Gammaproteobacteria bacterium]